MDNGTDTEFGAVAVIVMIVFAICYVASVVGR